MAAEVTYVPGNCLPRYYVKNVGGYHLLIIGNFSVGMGVGVGVGVGAAWELWQLAYLITYLPKVGK